MQCTLANFDTNSKKPKIAFCKSCQYDFCFDGFPAFPGFPVFLHDFSISIPSIRKFFVI